MATELLGEFELDRSRLIGKGAWGEVYLGRQVSLNRPVAIKILKREMTADEEFVKRFKRESECLAKMVDEHIIQVYSAGEYQGSYYFAMELVRGYPLSKVIEAGRKFSVNEIVYVAESVAKAMKTAWESPARIVHRDIKPSNIMVSYTSSIIAPVQSRLGRDSAVASQGISESAAAMDADIMESKIKVMDFGLAKLTEGDKDATMAGTVIGTPKYLSPEQGMGNPVDIRSDIYSLGIVMYELATGRIPFSGETAVSVIRHHIYDTAIAPSHYNPDIPPHMEAIIMKCIQKDANKRYNNPNELVKDLDAFRHQRTPTYAVQNVREAVLDATLTPETVRRPLAQRGVSKRVLFYGVLAGLVIIAGLIIYLVWPKSPAGVVVNPPQKTDGLGKETAEQEYNKWMSEARRLMGEKKTEEASIALNNALKARPNDPAALTLKSELASPYYKRGTDCYDKGDYDGAIKAYTKAIELNSRYAEAHYKRGLTYYAKDEYDKAIADYTDVVNLNPQDALAYFYRGLAYYKKGDDNRAIDDYTRAIDLNKRDVDSYINRGLAYNRKGEYDRAIANYTTASDLSPRDPLPYYNRGWSYYNKGDYAGAIADYTKAIDLNPRDADAHYYRGLSYYNKGEHDNAIADYNTVIDINPKYVNAYFYRGIIYYNIKNDCDKAITDYNKVIELNSQYALAYYDRGLAYHKKEDYDQAIADYTAALKIEPNDADACYYRGLAYENKGSLKRAKADYQKALKINPKHQPAADKLKELEEK